MISSPLKTTNLERKRVLPVNSQKFRENVPATRRTENTWTRNQKSRKLKRTDHLDKASNARLRVSRLNQPSAKEMHTAAFTSVNKTGSSSFAVPKKAQISKTTPIMSIDDDDEFESLIKGIRTDTKPETIDLLSPQTAMKPKKTFTIPGTKKNSALTAPKPRAASKPKAPKRKVESDDDEDSFAFMAR